MAILTNTAKLCYDYENINLCTTATAVFIRNEENNMCDRDFICVKTTNVYVADGKLTLVIPPKNYYNCETVKICVCQSFPIGVNENSTVQIQLGATGAVYPATVCGKDIYADQMKCRNAYFFKVATDREVFAYCGNCPLRCTQHVFPPVLPLT